MNFIRSLLIVALAFAGVSFMSPVQAQYINSTVAVCDPANPANCVKPTASGGSGIGNCIYNATPPTYVDGATTDCQANVNGELRSLLVGNLQGNGDGSSNSQQVSVALRGSQSTIFTMLTVAPYIYDPWNGNWNRNFYCSASVPVSVTAGTTLELVAVNGGQKQKVCSFTLTATVNATAKFITGTGANCATAPSDVTGAMAIAANGNLSLTGSPQLFQSVGGQALCLTATGGNITGFISHARSL